MLQITIQASESAEMWDERKQEFVYIPAIKGQTLQLEHSLVSLSKWESKWHKPYYSNKDKTNEEILDYIRCMTINKNVDPEVYNNIDEDNLKRISDYIYDPMTATTINDGNGKKNRETITSELIYYWMIAQNIPFECEKWHLNRLITLVRVCSAKNSTPTKQSKRDIMSRNAALNAARRKKLNSKG